MNGIRFPKMHIATSVQNRIMNTLGELLAAVPPQGAAGSMPNAPQVGGDLQEQSAAISDQLSQPGGSMPPVEEQLDAANNMATGRPPLDSLLAPK